MSKIMLLDGNSLINRAFYAMPILTDKNGEYTNAVYGFLNIFFKLIDEEQPEMCIVCFDVHQPTFRHLKFAEYKGTRHAMPEELRPQIPLLKKVLASMNIKTMELGGYEADDLLGTLAKKAESEGISPVIVSGDRDLLQLASETILVRIPKTKGGQTVVENYYSQQVFETYGVTPSEFIEMKALMGDTSDNVPGVPSVGEKTAAKIIQQFKTVENAIAHADEVKPKKAAENLKTYSEQALLSKWLVTIDTNAPIEADFSQAKTDNMFCEAALNEFKEHNFKTFLGRFEQNSAPTELKFFFTDDKKESEKLISDLDGTFACELFFEDGKLEAAAISCKSLDGALIALPEAELIELLAPVFDSDKKIIFHDIKTAYVYFKKNGIELKNAVFDTMIAAYLLDPSKNDYSHSSIADTFLHYAIPTDEQFFGKGKSRKTFGETIMLEREKTVSYCCGCAWVNLSSKAALEKEIEEKGMSSLYFDIELPLVYVLGDMELYGMRVDRSGIVEYGEQLQVKIDELTKEIYWLAGEEFNINSPKQLGVILFEKLGLKGGKKTKTGWSTSADILEKLADKDEIVGKVLEYRSHTKLKSTYADGLLAVIDESDGKIHSTFNQTITATGRISSTEPNLQNIPIKMELGRRLRKVFIPDDDFIYLDGDYSQIELCLLAHLSGDETLINAFKNGQDIHRLTASQVFNVPFDEVTPLQRSNAKAVNFGIIYGMGAFSLSQDLGISRAEAESYIEGYFAKYPKVKQYLENSVEFAKKNGYAKTAYGRIRYIPEISSSNFNLRGFGERVAMNMPIQGTAADIIKIAMLRVRKALENHRSRLVLQVHDELLLEVYKPELEEVTNILMTEMGNAAALAVPLVVDAHTGETWYDAK